jgi:hypothetical protein
MAATSERPRTGRNISTMPPASEKPGFKRGRHRLPYWIAKQVVRDPRGFPDPCIALPPDADDKTLGELCRGHTARLYAWLDQVDTEDGPPATVTPYNGTVLSACRIYQEHPFSRFHKVKHNTRKTYTDSLKILESSVGSRLIRRLTVLDVQHWYDEWRRPAAGAETERVDRAHDAVSMFRTVIRFCAALRHPECKLLAQELELVKFEKGGAREQEMTFAQASAFIRTALELGTNGEIPADRARYMAIGVAALFETMLRQKDIIGERRPAAPGTKGALYYDDWMWSGYFRWEAIPGWRWRTRTSKSKYRAAAEFDLANYGLLFPLLEAVPHEQRTGAIVKDETLRPVREGSYRRWFRAIARRAGIPDEVWSMDARAGGATEAEEAGAEFEAISDALTHSEKGTTVRYIRRRTRRIASVQEARTRKRAAEQE